MKCVAITLLALCFVLGDASVVAHGAQQPEQKHPIGKVIHMIEGLMKKVEMEAKHEEVLYNKFVYWAGTTTAALEKAIAEEKATIAELTDQIASLEKKAQLLKEQIEALVDQLAKLEEAGSEADANRKKEAALYDEVQKDLKATIAAFEEAIKALEEAGVTTEAALAQLPPRTWALVEAKVSAEKRGLLDDLLQTSSPAPAPMPPILARGDYAAHVDKYRFKSQSVIEMLKGLHTEFSDKLVAATTAETNSINAYELSKQAREGLIAAAEKSKGIKTTELGETKRDLGDARGALKDAEADLKADSASLKATQDAAAIKKQEWEERTKTRAEELKAMEMAIEILSKATGVRTEAPTNPVPPVSPVEADASTEAPAAASFLQVQDPQAKAITLIRKAAEMAHSKALERLAVEVAAHLEGPVRNKKVFDEVINMIQKMIFRLQQEQTDEDTHKHWCDLEIEKTLTMKEDKEAKIAELEANIDVEEGKVAELTSDIEKGQKMIAEINAFVEEATEIRQVGKKENAEALEDAVQAQTAIANAQAVLRDFYKDSGMIEKEPWEFLQEPLKLPESPSTWDSGYTGVADPKDQPHGILSVLERVGAEFAAMEAETKQAEAQDQEEYEQEMKRCEIEKAQRTQEVEMKSQEKAQRVDTIKTMESEKKLLEQELEKTMQYLKDLEPACMAGNYTYEERKEARSGEIQALHQAQAILTNAFNQPASPPSPPSFGPSPAPAPKFLHIKKH